MQRHEVSFHEETLDALLDDGLEGHVLAHWREVGVWKDRMPLAVDWPKYQRLEEDGTLKLFSLRRGERLVAYSSFLCQPGLHYATTLHCLNDAVYVKKAERGAGLLLIRETEKALARHAAPGWARIIYHVKVRLEAERGTYGRVFEHLGYTPFEQTYDKMVRA